MRTEADCVKCGTRMINTVVLSDYIEHTCPACQHVQHSYHETVVVNAKGAVKHGTD